MGHFIEKCQYCGTIISQCRCMDCSKEIRWSTCLECVESRSAGIQKKLEKPDIDNIRDLSKMHKIKHVPTIFMLCDYIDQLEANLDGKNKHAFALEKCIEQLEGQLKAAREEINQWKEKYYNTIDYIT